MSGRKYAYLMIEHREPRVTPLFVVPNRQDAEEAFDSFVRTHIEAGWTVLWSFHMGEISGRNGEGVRRACLVKTVGGRSRTLTFELTSWVMRKARPAIPPYELEPPEVVNG